VVYRLEDTDFLFEPAAQSPERMIRRLADVMHDYVPHFAVNRRMATCAFVGCALDSSRDMRRRSDAGRARLSARFKDRVGDGL
jgi:hypothetical protein